MTQNKQQRFLALYQPISVKISNYCRMIADTSSDAEDLLHDTILVAYEKLDDLKSEVAFPSFLYSTAYNIYSKQLRRKKFQGNYNEQAATFIKSIDANAETKTELQLVYEKMKLLPKEQYEALVLFHISDLPLDEIQKIQDVSLSAVKQRLKRGRQKLFELLSEKQKHIALLML